MTRWESRAEAKPSSEPKLWRAEASILIFRDDQGENANNWMPITKALVRLHLCSSCLTARPAACRML
jgi:hypothetical protein